MIGLDLLRRDHTGGHGIGTGPNDRDIRTAKIGLNGNAAAHMSEVESPGQ